MIEYGKLMYIYLDKLLQVEELLKK